MIKIISINIFIYNSFKEKSNALIKQHNAKSNVHLIGIPPKEKIEHCFELSELFNYYAAV